MTWDWIATAKKNCENELHAPSTNDASSNRSITLSILEIVNNLEKAAWQPGDAMACESKKEKKWMARMTTLPHIRKFRAKVCYRSSPHTKVVSFLPPPSIINVSGAPKHSFLSLSHPRPLREATAWRKIVQEIEFYRTIIWFSESRSPVAARSLRSPFPYHLSGGICSEVYLSWLQRSWEYTFVLEEFVMIINIVVDANNTLY